MLARKNRRYSPCTHHIVSDIYYVGGEKEIEEEEVTKVSSHLALLIIDGKLV